MHFAITDTDQNTPLLEAAQPRELAQRATALIRLKERLEAGTLVISKVQSEYFSERLQAVMPNGHACMFEEVVTDPNMAFDLLGASREEFYLSLISFSGTKEFENICQKLADEILEQILTGHLTLPDQNFINFTQSSNNLILALKEAREDMLTYEGNNYDQCTANDLLAAISENKVIVEDEKVNKLKTALEAFNITQDNLRQHCKTKENVTHYLNTVRQSNLAIGYVACMIYAEIKKIPMFIWTRQPGTSNLLLINNPTVNLKRNPRHLLVKDSFTDLKYIIATGSVAQPDNPYQLHLIKVNKPLEEKNKDGHNLLHRAVRSIAADILVPYILETLNFKSSINQLDIYRKTALHRAIKYFAEFRAKFLLGLSQADYQQIVMVTLSALVLAGSDLTLKDHEQKTALDRAKNYQTVYQFDPVLNLHNWLLEKKPAPTFKVPAAPLENKASAKQSAGEKEKRGSSETPAKKPAEKKRKASAKKTPKPSAAPTTPEIPTIALRSPQPKIPAAAPTTFPFFEQRPEPTTEFVPDNNWLQDFDFMDNGKR